MKKFLSLFLVFVMLAIPMVQMTAFAAPTVAMVSDSFVEFSEQEISEEIADLEAEVTYEVRFDANGGELDPLFQIKKEYRNLTIKLEVPFREGYTFMGWATSPDAKKAEYLPGSIYSEDEDIVLYAVWSDRFSGYNSSAAEYMVVATPNKCFEWHESVEDLILLERRDGYYGAYMPPMIYCTEEQLGIEEGKADEYFLNVFSILAVVEDAEIHTVIAAENKAVIKKTVTDLELCEVTSDKADSYFEGTEAKLLSGKIIADGTEEIYVFNAPQSYADLPYQPDCNEESKYNIRNSKNVKLLSSDMYYENEEKKYDYYVSSVVDMEYDAEGLYYYQAEQLVEAFKQVYYDGLYEADLYDIDGDGLYDFIDYKPYMLFQVDGDEEYYFDESDFAGYDNYELGIPYIYTQEATVIGEDFEDGDVVIGYFDAALEIVKIAAVVKPTVDTIASFKKSEGTLTLGSGEKVDAVGAWRMLYNFMPWDYVIVDADEYNKELVSESELFSVHILDEKDPIEFYIHDGVVLLTNEVNSVAKFTENLIIPTEIKPVREAPFDPEAENEIYYVYAWVDGEMKYVKVEYNDDVYPRVTDGGCVNEEYLNKLCTYTVEDGIYTIYPLGTDVVDEDGDVVYEALADLDSYVLVETKKEDQVYAELGDDLTITKIAGTRFDIGADFDVDFKPYTKIIIRVYDAEKDEYEYVEYDASSFNKSLCEDVALCNVQVVVANNPDSVKRENLVLYYAETEDLAFAGKADKNGYRIVSGYDIGEDKDGKWRLFYELYDPYTGAKVKDVPSVAAETKATNLIDAAVATGTIVELVEGQVDEDEVVAAIDTSSLAAANLVWITEVDEAEGFFTVAPYDACLSLKDEVDEYVEECVAYGAPVTDIYGNELYSGNIIDYDKNTVVSVISRSAFNRNFFADAAMKLSDMSAIAKAGKDVLAYNTKAVDINGNPVIMYADYVKAFISVDEDKYDAEEGTNAVAEFIIVVVNDNEPSALDGEEDEWIDTDVEEPEITVPETTVPEGKEFTLSEIVNKLIIPTDIKPVKEAPFDPEAENEIYYVYAWVDGEMKYVKVELNDDVYPWVTDGCEVMHEFLNKPCVYTIEDGIYTIYPIDVDMVNEYLDKLFSKSVSTDIEVLNDTENTTLFYTQLGDDVPFTNVIGTRYDIGCERDVFFTSYTTILVRVYDPETDEYQFRIYNSETFKQAFESGAVFDDVSVVIANKKDSIEREHLALYYGEIVGTVDIPQNPEIIPEATKISLDSIKNNLIIPTDIKHVREASFDPEAENEIYYVYAWVDGEMKYVKVELNDDVYPWVTDGANVAAEYLNKLCTYTVKDNIYTIYPLGTDVVDEDDDVVSEALAAVDSGVLAETEKEDLVYAELGDDLTIVKVAGTRFDICADFHVDFTDETRIIIRVYDYEKDEYEYVEYDASSFNKSLDEDVALCNVQVVVANNKDSTKRENLVLYYAETEDLAFASKADKNGYRIVSGYNFGQDEDGKWRLFYELYDPYTGAKVKDVPSVAAETKAANLIDAAVATGTIVELIDGQVDEDEIVATVDTSSLAAANLVWIAEVDEAEGFFTVAPYDACLSLKDEIDEYVEECVAYGASVTDIYGETLEVGNFIDYDENTVVSVISGSTFNRNFFADATMKLSDMSAIAKAGKDVLAYNTKAEDRNGNYVTKYADYVKAFISVDTDKYDEGETNAVAEFIIVVVNDGEHSALFGTSSGNHSSGNQNDERVSVSDISLNLNELSLKVGGRKSLIPSVKPYNASNQAVVWTSSDPTVATVDKDGIITAKKMGRTTITAATVDGNFTAACEVTVVTDKVSADLYVVLSDERVSPGKIAPVKVNVVRNPGVSAYKFTVDYDKELLTPVSVTANPEMGGTLTTNLDDGAKSELNVLWSSVEDVADVSELFTVNFMANNNASDGATAYVSVSCDANDICNTKGTYFTLYSEAATVLVKEPIPGDLFENDDVDVYDLTLLARYITALETFTDRQKESGDVNNDGIVDIKDVVKLSQYLVGWTGATLMAESAGTADIKVGTATVNDKGVAEIPVYIENNSGIAGFRYEIDYEADEVEILSITPNTEILPANFMTNLGSEGDNGLVVSWYQNDDMTKDGVMFTVTARLKDDILSSDLSIVEADNNMCDSDIHNVIGNYESGSIKLAEKKEFQSSMQAYLNLESEVTMSVGYKLVGMENLKPADHLDNLGLLIWDAATAPAEADATIDNCETVIEGAKYNGADKRFETTTDGIAAKNLGDNLTFRAYYHNADGTYSYSRLITNYSPKKYCYNQIKNYPDDKANTALMAAILNYGTEAQIYFGYNTDNLMNSDLSTELKTVAWDASLVRSDYSVPNGKDSDFVRASEVTSRGGYLNLEGAIDYNFYAAVNFTPKSARIYYWTEADIANVSKLTLANASSSEEMTYNSAKSRYEGKYEGQAAKEMFGTIFSLMVFEKADGTKVVSGVVGYSPERYAYINYNKTNNEASLSRALVVYGDAARTYFNK